MDIRNFVICDNAQVVPTPDNQGAITVLVNPQPVLRPKYIPGVMSFTISFGVVGILITDIKSVEVKLRYHEASTPCMTARQDVAIELGMDADPSDAFPTFNFDMRNVDMQSEGDYSVDILINDELVTTHTLTVKKMKV